MKEMLICNVLLDSNTYIYTFIYLFIFLSGSQTPQKKANPYKAIVPGYLKYLIKKCESVESNKMYKFPTGMCDMVVNDDFWIALFGLDKGKNG